MVDKEQIPHNELCRRWQSINSLSMENNPNLHFLPKLLEIQNSTYRLVKCTRRLDDVVVLRWIVGINWNPRH